MTRPSGCPIPATNGRASLSRRRSRRFLPHWQYRASQDHPGGGNVAIVNRAAAIANPTPDGEGQLLADVAAVGTNSRAAREATVNVPRPPRPVGLIVERPNELSQPGVSQRTRHPGPHHAAQAQIFNGEAAVGIDKFPRRLVHRVFPGVAKGAMRTAKPNHGALAVHAALAPPVSLSVQPAQAFRGLPGEARVRDLRAIAQSSQVVQSGVDPDHGQRRRGVDFRGRVELDGDVPAVRLLRHRDLLHIRAIRQRSCLAREASRSSADGCGPVQLGPRDQRTKKRRTCRGIS